MPHRHQDGEVRSGQQGRPQLHPAHAEAVRRVSLWRWVWWEAGHGVVRTVQAAWGRRESHPCLSARVRDILVVSVRERHSQEE